MSNVIGLIDNLLNYAKNNLGLSEYDVGVKRNLLRAFLKVDGGDGPASLSDNKSYTDLKEGLSEYLSQSKICSDKDIDGYVSFIFGILLPLPSVINKKFLTLREKFGADAACDYLYDLAVKSGAVSKSDFSEKSAAYYLSDGAEIIVCDALRKKEDLPEKGDDEQSVNKVCPLCRNAEGLLFENGGVFGALRSVTLKLGDEDWIMRYVNAVDKERECAISYGEHEKIKSSGDIAVAMLDFIEYLPEYSAQSIQTARQKGFSHSYFIACTTKLTNALKTPAFTATGDTCPDVEISLYNRGASIVRLQSFNRNTLEYLALEIISKWQDYVDKSVSICGTGADGAVHNSVSLNAMYSCDNRYTLDIALVAEKPESDYSDGDTIFDKKIDDSCVFERFVLSEDFARVTEAIAEVLTKKRSYQDAAADEFLAGYEDVIESLINDCGYFKDGQKALAEVKNRLTDCLLKAQNKKSAFLNDDEGTRAFKRFLSTVGVR